MQRPSFDRRPTIGSSSRLRLFKLTLLFGLLLLFSTSAAAERLPSMVPGGRAMAVPKDLMPWWVPWVVDGLG